MTVFERTKEIANKKGLSLQEVATKAGLGLNSIYGWKKKDPSISRLTKVAKVLDVSVDELLGKPSTSPDWATDKDVNDLHEFLKTNGQMNYKGVSLNKEQRERVDQIITQVFWEELEKEKKKSE